MKKRLAKYISLIIIFLILSIVYLSKVGLETKKFNRQIKDKIYQKNNKLDFELKKIKLTLDPLNLKINAKTIGTKIAYKDKQLELEYIETQIPLISLLKNELIASNFKISTKSILLKDLVAFVRTQNNRPELFFLEQFIKSGYFIADLELNFDEYGKLKEDYKINGLLKDTKINFLKNNNFKKINFLFNITGNNFNFKDISFTTNNIDFLSNKINITKNKDDYGFEGTIENKNSILNTTLLKLIKLNNKKFNFQNINFDSKNNFSFKINNKLKLKDLIIDSEIKINRSEYKASNLIKKDLLEINEVINLKNHKIKAIYKKDSLLINGLGKIRLKNKFDEINYQITSKGSDFNFSSNILLNELNIKNKEFTKNFFPKIKQNINLKNHKVNIDFIENNLSVKGSGKIKIENKLEQIDYSFSKNADKYNFDTKLDINNTLVKIDFLNYKKNKAKLKILGSYSNTNGLNFNELNIEAKDNQILINNLLLDKEYKIIKLDKVDLDYFDIYNKKNEFTIQRNKNNDYKLSGSIFNADSLISNLLKSKDTKKTRIFKNDINLTLNLSDVYVDNENIVKNLNGNLRLEKNKITQANIKALFDNNENLIFTVNTKKDEKITTLFSSKAKPLVKRYKFIKGYEEGYLDFYSSKKNETLKSTLKIYDFKLQEVPALTKLLTLASLQGIADLVSGEGIRFNEFEMNFTKKNNLMIIDEIYAIGPAISILMEGYIDQNKLISLKGTLVPATTLNKVIGSIPLLGKILVGSKTGEGVFGVSFKIKGKPNDLKTTVNPIKTLTPRFITRTLDKIKKN